MEHVIAGLAGGRPLRILTVGGGFAGIYTARRLRCGEAVVTLVDPRGFMTFDLFLVEAPADTIEPRHAVTWLRRGAP
jgi:NADH dehydrogenase